MNKDAPKFIYFIKPVGMSGPIKIGCSMRPLNRLMEMAIWSPLKLELLHQQIGSHELERNIQMCFADYHSHLEWFRAGPRLTRAISKLQAGVPIAEAIDLSDVRGERFVVDGKRVLFVSAKGRARAIEHGTTSEEVAA
jgi:hypothetical protein